MYGEGKGKGHNGMKGNGKGKGRWKERARERDNDTLYVATRVIGVEIAQEEMAECGLSQTTGRENGTRGGIKNRSGMMFGHRM